MDGADGAPDAGDADAAQGLHGVCPKCGNDNPPDSKFCRRCGAGLVSTPPSRQASTTAPAAGLRPGEWPRWAPIAGVVILLLITGGVAAVLLSGGGGGDDPGSEPAAASSPIAEPETNASAESAAPSNVPSSPSATAPASRPAILDVLHEYENAYSEASVAAMGALLTGDVLRHGLKAGGCSTEAGKRAVLDAYESQFSQNGPVGYELAGLSAGDVQLLGDEEARVETEYSIAVANNSGPISFTLVDHGDGWRISEVDATCSPSSP